ncbi:MAG TPA: LysM peptidoglycan-binding domain-containing protein [Acidimicrobiales bacterium]
MESDRRARVAATLTLGIAATAIVAACGSLGGGVSGGATSTSVSTVFRTIPISSTTTTAPPAPSAPGQPGQPGQPSATSAALGAGESLYTVKSGDTYVGIAKSHGVSYSALAAANGWDPNNPPVLFPGNKVRVPPKPAATTTTRPPVSTIQPGVIAIHTVKAGDTYNGIARQYGVQVTDIYNLNGINAQTVMHPGAKLKIPVPRG